MAGARELILAVCVGLLAFCYYKNYSYQNQHLQKILTGLVREETSANVTKNLRVAVGFGSCLDLVVDALPLFKSLSLRPPEKPKHHNPLRDREGLAETFAYFMREGAAAE